MQSKPLFYLTLLSLSLVGGWGILHINSRDDTKDQTSEAKKLKFSTLETQKNDFEQGLKVALEPRDRNAVGNSYEGASFDDVLALIHSGQATQAANAINQHYSNLSSSNLDSLKSALLALAFEPRSKTKYVLLATSKAFDEPIIWSHLGDAAIADDDWNTAFSAYFRASELENNPTDLDILLNKLVLSSGHLRSTFEGNGDLLSVKNLFQRLSDLHPNFQRFQYELAISNLKLGEIESATQLLQLLIYHPELGQISKQTLAQIGSQTTPHANSDSSVVTAPQANIHTNDIVVPLISAGSSFIVNSTIENTSARLLLDTGASITSLSSNLVRRLKLVPTGRSIRLGTANGIANARLYRIEQLRFGSVVLQDMVVAEIDLGNNRGFQGLLGTDALNQLKPQYSYVIDNQASALIFRKR